MEGNNFHSRSEVGEEIEPLESRVTAFSLGGEFGNRNSNSQPDLGELEIASKHNDLQAMVGFKSQQVAKHEECDTELAQCTVEESDEKRGFVSQQLAKPEECDTELPECTKEENDEKEGSVSQQIAIHEECYSGLPQCMNKKNDEKGGFVSQQMAKPEECDTKLHQHTRQENDKKSGTIGRQMVNTEECDTELPKQTSEKNDEKSGFIGQQRAKLEECDIELPKQTKEENNYKKELNVSYQKGGKYFFYDSPLPEETGVWIPVSVPPMSESEHAEWSRGFCSNGGYFPEGDLGWSQYDGEDKELTMWDVVIEMVLVARGKVSALASGDIHKISWISSHLIEQAWKEMAQTLTEANVSDTREILEAKPPKWLPDSAASACMLCSVRFHPIMCTRHHCRFCGGVFCSECTKGRSLLPEKFCVGDPQRVCDVCCVRLESVQPCLMEQVSRAARLPTHDLTDLSTLRSWVNFPWGQSMEYEIYKATNTIRGYNTVGSLRPEKAIPEAILRQAKGLAILTVLKVGVMVTYNIGTGLVIARREDGSWSPPSAISSFGVRWGAQAGGELTDFIIVLRTNDAVKTFSGDVHLSFGAGLSAAAGVVGRTVEADLRAGDGGYAACFTYSCSKGAFVGCSLGGSIITTRKLENSRFYGSQFINASDILLGSLPRPPGAGILYRALADLYQKFRG